MADDPTSKNRIADRREHEIRYFPEQNDLTVELARDLIDRFGNDRVTLEDEF